MAGSNSGWAMPPAPPTNQNPWMSQGDQPPSYEEALSDTRSHSLQAAVVAYAASHGINPMYPPLPPYEAQAPGATSTSLSHYPAQAPETNPFSTNPAHAPNTNPFSTHPVQAPGTNPVSPYPVQAPNTNPFSNHLAHAPNTNPFSNYPIQAPVGNPLPHSTSQRRDSLGVQRVMSNEELMAWWRTVKPWEKMSHSPETEPRMLAKKVHRVQRAIQLYRLLMSTHGQVLQMHINELQRASESITKAYNALKAAGVTRGTTGAVGGAAAVTGIVLAPFTMGASLAITAVGIGVAAAGGLSKKSVKKSVAINQDRRALEANVQDYRNKLEDIQNCLQFIYTGMEHLGRNNLSILKGVDMDARQVGKLLEQAGVVAQGLGAASRSSDLLRGFAGGIGSFYSKKDQTQLKKGKEHKFGKTLYKVAGRLQTTQTELTQVSDSLGRF